MSELILEKNPMNVNYAEGPSLLLFTFKYTNELIQERGLMNVSNAEKPSVLPLTFKSINELILGRNFLIAISVIRL